MPLPTHGFDASSVANEFARRLDLAVRERGMSLSLLRSHLVSRGVEVSVATLSYWTTGRSRPTRATSMATLAALEEVLGLPAGHLVQALPVERAYHPPSTMMSPGEELANALEELALPGTAQRQRLLLHDVTVVGPDRRERSTTTRQVLRAEVDELDRWAIIVKHDPGQEVEVSAVSGIRLGRQLRLAATDTVVVEALLPRPLLRGESLCTVHRVEYSGGTEETCHAARALNRHCRALVMEARFEGSAPRSARRLYLDTERVEHPVADTSLYLAAGGLQSVVPDAVAGIHAIAWQW